MKLRFTTLGAATALALLIVLAIGQAPAAAERPGSERTVSGHANQTNGGRTLFATYTRSCVVPPLSTGQCGATFQVPNNDTVNVKLTQRDPGGGRVDALLRLASSDSPVGQEVQMSNVGNGGRLWTNGSGNRRTVYVDVGSPSLERFGITLRLTVN